MYYSTANVMQISVTNDEMPPWPTKTGYQHYSSERFLTPTEKTTILDWISQGRVYGTQANEPAPPFLLDPIDLTR